MSLPLFLNSFLGMFLFAKLVMNNLAKQPNLALFRNEIASARLPNEIDQAYVHINHTINSS